MLNKEIMQLVLRICLYTTMFVVFVTTVYFIIRVAYLVKKCNMAIEDALDSAMNTVIGICKDLQKFSVEIQKAQLTTINSDISLCLQYYEIQIKCWLHKIGLL